MSRGGGAAGGSGPTENRAELRAALMLEGLHRTLKTPNPGQVQNTNPRTQQIHKRYKDKWKQLGRGHVERGTQTQEEDTGNTGELGMST